MQRCLAKAIALHGIGLYIYSGEDIPDAPVKEVVKPTEADLTVAKDKLLEASKRGELKQAFFGLTPEVQTELRDYANELKKSA